MASLGDFTRLLNQHGGSTNRREQDIVRASDVQQQIGGVDNQVFPQRRKRRQGFWKLTGIRSVLRKLRDTDDSLASTGPATLST